jgi:hypothetical protein
MLTLKLCEEEQLRLAVFTLQSRHSAFEILLTSLPANPGQDFRRAAIRHA